MLQLCEILCKNICEIFPTLVFMCQISFFFFNHLDPRGCLNHPIKEFICIYHDWLRHLLCDISTLQNSNFVFPSRKSLQVLSRKTNKQTNPFIPICEKTEILSEKQPVTLVHHSRKHTCSDVGPTHRGLRNHCGW